MEVEKPVRKKNMLFYCMGCFSYFPSSSPSVDGGGEGDEKAITKSEAAATLQGIGGGRRPGGWRSMPYIIGNETFERLATMGMMANFTVYLVNHLHMRQVKAANLANVWFGTTNFAPLIGAFLSDAYLGRYLTLAFASVASFLGMVGMTLTAAIPSLQPPDCTAVATAGNHYCENGGGPTGALLGLLLLSLALLTVGAGGVRPCSLPFGVDQFDATTDHGRKGIESFFNWYYFTLIVAVMVALTAVVYVQNSISWAVGLAIPAALMLLAIVVFFLGTRVYVYVPPEGSVFSGVAQVFVAAYRKRRVELPTKVVVGGGVGGDFYDPPVSKTSSVVKLSLTQQFRFLNNAAMILEDDGVGAPGGGEESLPDGSPANRWRLCSVQQVEEAKCLLRIAPIWASGILCFMAMAQQDTVSVLQALKMDRHMGPHFQIPPGSLAIVSMLSISLFIPLYDRLLLHLTVLRRMGAGASISLLSMLVAASIEKRRRTAALDNNIISVWWLSPQLGLMGVAEALNGIGQIEFYNRQFPEHMRSIGNSLFFCSFAGASYLSSFIMALVRRLTGGAGGHNWLDDDINRGRLDYYYYLLAGLGVVNLVYFIVCAHYYRYKGSLEGGEEAEHGGGDGVVV